MTGREEACHPVMLLYGILSLQSLLSLLSPPLSLPKDGSFQMDLLVLNVMRFLYHRFSFAVKVS